MKETLLKIVVITLFVVKEISGQTTISCVSCSHVAFQDVGFTDLELFHDPNCKSGIGKIETCPLGYVCASVIGIETQDISGYGELDLHVVIRGCEDATLLDTSQGPSGCIPADQHEDYLAGDEFDPDAQFIGFEGEICYCSEDICNNVMAPPVQRPVISHTPPPNTPGLQCRLCSHIEFHEDVLNDPTLSNFDCEDGQLASEDVYYITCTEGSVCLNLRGQITYSIPGLDITADVHERRCYFLGDAMDAQSGCVDEDEISDYQTDYYSYFDDIIFQGGACYCTSDLCDCDPDICLETNTLTCADHDFCPGPHETCVDGFLSPRCECDDGYGFDDRFQCQKVAVSCITCSSRHFLGHFTSSTLSEDLDCEAGFGPIYSCPEDSVCVTLVGTETNLHDGYGPVQSRVVHRGCELQTLFDESSPCLSDPLSGNILNIDNRFNFTGEACYCSENNCNSELKEIDRIIRPPIPPGDPQGLQCVTCLSRHPISPRDASNITLDRACVEGDLTDPNVYYVTCPSDHSCLKLQGVFRFWLGGEFVEYVNIERRCVPNTYTMSGDSGCVATDDVRDNLEEEYSSYYFYFDVIEIEAPACYCSTDICDCDVTACKTDPSDGETCESEGVCDKPHENCHDTTTAGPVCFCEFGYSYNANRDCELDVSTCADGDVCIKQNEHCEDVSNVPLCVCDTGYEYDDDGNCVLAVITCDEGNFCTEPNEHCEDMFNTPTCVCDDGYEYDDEENCVQGFTCRTKVCSIANSECMDLTDGPSCVCIQNYELDSNDNRCKLIQNNNQDVNKGGDSKGSKVSQLSPLMLLIVTMTGVILTLQ